MSKSESHRSEFPAREQQQQRNNIENAKIDSQYAVTRHDGYAGENEKNKNNISNWITVEFAYNLDWIHLNWWLSSLVIVDFGMVDLEKCRSLRMMSTSKLNLVWLCELIRRWGSYTLLSRWRRFPFSSRLFNRPSMRCLSRQWSDNECSE